MAASPGLRIKRGKAENTAENKDDEICFSSGERTKGESMSQERSIESTIQYAEKLRRTQESGDSFVEHLRSVLPRDEAWRVFK